MRSFAAAGSTAERTCGCVAPACVMLPSRSMRRMTMTGALLRGLMAGAIGAEAQTLFFRVTSGIAPPTPKEAFQPPESVQEHETPTVTVARRIVEGLVRAGPLEKRSLAGQIVHVGYGAAWGGIYGVLRRSTRLMRGVLAPLGGLAFGALVWAVSDNLLLPAFRLSAWPNRYPMKNHAYGLAAHLVYGAATWGVFELEATRALAPVAAVAAARWATRNLPDVARPAVRRVVRKAFVARAKLPNAIDRVIDAAESVAR